MSLIRMPAGVTKWGAGRLVRWGAALMSLCSALSVSPAMAQSVGTDQPPPIHSAIDANGINLINGSLNFNDLQVAVGQPGKGGLARAYPGGLGSGALWSRDNLTGTINSSGSTYTVSLGALSINFTLSGSTFTSQQGDGSTLTNSGTNYTLVLRDGTTALFSTSVAGGVGIAANVARIATLTRPSGEVDTYTYTAHSYQLVPPFYLTAYRIDAVTNNFGYEIKYLYLGNGSLTLSDLILSKIIAINNAVDYCAPTATSCPSLTVTWPTVSYNNSTGAVTDNLGRATYYPTIGASKTVSLIRPSGLTISYTTDSSARVITVANGVGTWHYAYSAVGANETTTVTDPNGHTRVVTSNTNTVLMASDTNGLSQTTSYGYDTYGRVTKITNPETDFIGYTYDTRGNITQTVVTGKDQVSTLTTTAGFDTTCTLPAKCNEPNWTKDAKGNETDFTYSGSTGQVLTIVKPLGANGLRPETDYSYTSEYAWYKNSSGSIVQAGSPISLLTQVSQCATAQTCIGTVHSFQSAYNYGLSGVANNLLPVSLTQGAGDGSLLAVTSFIYDSVGNLYTVQDPSGNFARYRYDTVRQLVGIVGPDPDGAGPLHNRAVRLTYECDASVKAGCDGLSTLKEVGTVVSQADADWAAFSTLGQDAAGYDGVDRKVTEIVSSAGNYVSATQYSYDADNRLTCSAVRMNPSAIGSLPASACTLGAAGSAGPDRVTTYSYDNADRLLQVTGASGTTVASNEETDTYGADGEILTQADGRGDLTTIVRDTFNRVYQVQFPTPANGTVSSTTDYEQYTYDNNGNVTQNRRRNGALINFGNDALNHRTSNAYIGATYGYDNLGRMTTAAVYGLSESFGYDALNRQISETASTSTVGTQYDLNGNLIRLTYPDNYYVVYGYDAANELTSLTDSNSVTLLQQSYNNLGQISSITRTSGPSEVRGYGPDLRLSSQAYSFSDTSKNVNFSYTYNLAGQPMTMTPDNAAYINTSSPAATTYVSDGLNRYTTVGGLTQTYDGLSDLTNDGSNSASFDSLNRMYVLRGTSISYDALNRPHGIVGSTTSYLLYFGQQVVATYDGSHNLVDRYVPGLQLDSSLLWYPGSSTSVSGANWLVTNAFGSVVAGAYSGTADTTTYDAFGISGSAGISAHNGTLGFKGMLFSGYSDFYLARARAYSAKQGRFLQPDPIGYADGLNLYHFVHNSPVDGMDPMGTCGWESHYHPGSGDVVPQNSDGGFDQGAPVTPGSGYYSYDYNSVGCNYTVSYVNYGSGGPAPPQSKCVGSPFSSFFANNYGPASKVGSQYNIDPSLLLGLAAAESAYGTSSMATTQNNPFGATPGGFSTPGITYNSYASAWQNWGNQWGPRVNNVGGNVGQFINNLALDNQGVVGAVDSRGPYNTQNAATGGNPNWATLVTGAIAGVQSRLPVWQKSGC